MYMWGRAGRRDGEEDDGDVERGGPSDFARRMNEGKRRKRTRIEAKRKERENVCAEAERERDKARRLSESGRPRHRSD